ncbi:hypothetical protein AN958_10970 [Leucoagaricus sp. SymC.cos]|nr:hypothetical protein AN958_10970 [Leucoagaricus sp. SymC.cos]
MKPVLYGPEKLTNTLLFIGMPPSHVETRFATSKMETVWLDVETSGWGACSPFVFCFLANVRLCGNVATRSFHLEMIIGLS